MSPPPIKANCATSRTAAQAHSLSIDPLPALADIPAPDEDGATFAVNATIKAVYYSSFAPGALVVADDSGLEVDALDGAPGVRSARFAADAGMTDSPDANDNTDVWNNIVLIQRMAYDSHRSAHGPLPLRSGRCPRRRSPPHRRRRSRRRHSRRSPKAPAASAMIRSSTCPVLDRTMAELDLETKLTLSHRGRAFAALLPMLIA